MNTKSLAESYLKKAMDRLDILDLLFAKGAFSDVIRESQEVVELSLKGMLRFVGVEPPKIHKDTQFVVGTAKKLLQA